MGDVIWWADRTVQQDRQAFHSAADEAWRTRMRWAKPLYMTAKDQHIPRRKFDQGSTLIVRTRACDGPEAA
jgi:hypothetical protein